MVELFFVCLFAGLLLVGAEVFLPGGILGSIGGMALLIAVVLGFIVYPAAGPYIAIGVVFLVGLVILLWIKVFPRSSVGRAMTVSKDLGEAKATEEGLDGLVGQKGVALSDLRPAGFAQISGRRVDVVTQGDMISKGENVRVAAIEGNRVVVNRIES